MQIFFNQYSKKKKSKYTLSKFETFALPKDTTKKIKDDRQGEKYLHNTNLIKGFNSVGKKKLCLSYLKRNTLLRKMGNRCFPIEDTNDQGAQEIMLKYYYQGNTLKATKQFYFFQIDYSE